MRRLEFNRRKPEEYYLSGKLVFPILVYGPIDYRELESSKLDIRKVIRKVKDDAGIDLDDIADSYVNGGFNIVSDEKRERIELICFFRAYAKPN